MLLNSQSYKDYKNNIISLSLMLIRVFHHGMKKWGISHGETSYLTQKAILSR